jgi:hypothetical protein
MKKKIILSVSLICLLSLIAILAVTKYNDLSNTQKNPIKAIPTNASVIIKSDDWRKSWDEIEASDIWQKISSTEHWQTLKTKIDKTKKTIEKSDELKKIFDKQLLYISLHSSTQNFDILFASTLSTKTPLKLLENNFLNQEYSRKKYDNETIYTLDNGWSFCIHQGIIFFASTHLLVENSIRQLNNSLSLLDDQSFVKVQETESNFSQTHVYLNYKNFSSLLKENYKIGLNEKIQISRWADWAELDLKAKNNNLIFSGFTLAQDSSSNFLNTLNGQKPQPFSMSAILPSNTHTISFLGLSDFKAYYAKYKKFLANHNNLYEHSKWIQEKDKKYEVQLEPTFSAIIDNELAMTSTYTASGNQEYFALIQAKEESIQIIQHLNKSITNDPFEENYRGFNIYQLHITNILPRLLGPLFNNVNDNFFCWIDGFLVFGNSSKALKTFINSFLSQKTLINNIYYQNYSDNISSKCNYLFYYNPSVTDWPKKLSSNAKKWVKEENWENVNAFAYQLSANNELFYNSVVIHYEPNMRDESQLTWSINLDNTFRMQPKFVKNHYTMMQEVAIQDDANKLYLISSNGKVLWKKNIGGEILGEIRQIDAFKNKKLQLLFNTTDSLYLIDRNGNTVENFPKKLKSKATAGHTLIDYDKNRKYRILIPAEDKMVYNYDKNGDLVKGWKFEKMPEKISQSIVYYLHDNKDYIYVIDKAGNAKIVGRNGKNRIKLGTIPLADKFYLDLNQGAVYSTDDRANVWKTNLDGNQLKVINNNYTEKTDFYAKNINYDEFIEFIFSEEKTICYQLDKKLFEYDIKSDFTPQVLEFNGQHFIGLSQGEYCYLLDSNGNLIKEMPLYGQGLFNISDTDNDGQMNLVVGNGDLLFNYTLE